MEHNHNPLIYGFLISFSLFGIGIAMSYISFGGVDIHSKLVVLTFGILSVIASIIMLKGTFKKRDACPICKDKYQYRRNK